MNNSIKIFVLLIACCLVGCSNSNTEERLIENKIISYINAISTGDYLSYQQSMIPVLTDSSVTAANQKDDIDSKLEDKVVFYTLQTLLQKGKYETISSSVSDKLATLTLKFTLPNYEYMIKTFYPDLMKNLAPANLLTEEYNGSMDLTKVIEETQSIERDIELINTFKLEYIEGSWYIVDEGELSTDIEELIAYINHSLM